MTITEYLTNPAGKGSSILSNTEIKNSLNTQFEIMRDKIKNIWYIKNDRYAICHISIPSRSAEGLRYDIVFEFDLLSVGANEQTINNAIMRCFSNCPSFSYTYAYTFNKQNLLCEWLSSKYDRKVLTKEPTVRNQYKIISYERTLYLAAKFIMTNDNNKLTYIQQRARRITNYVQISTSILSQSQIEDRSDAIKKIQQQQKEKETVSNDIGKVIPKTQGKTKTTDTVKTTEVVKKASVTDSIKKTSATRKTKTVKKI